MDNILDQCSIRELILFDVTKPMASSSTIITIAISAVILNNIIYNILTIIINIIITNIIIIIVINFIHYYLINDINNKDIDSLKIMF